MTTLHRPARPRRAAGDSRPRAAARADRRRAGMAEDGGRHAAAGRLGGLMLVTGTGVGAAAHASGPGAAAPGLLWIAAALATVTGVLCLAAPWRRLGASWLHLPPSLMSVLVGVAIAAHGAEGATYAPLAVCVGAFTAYAFRRRAAVAAHFAVTGACLVAALAHPAATVPVLAGQLAIVAFAFVSVTVLMVVLRERTEAGQATLRELAESDALTGVGNYRRLHARMAYEIARHRRSGQPLALLVLDLDGFKEVNDTLGHPAGDHLLRRVADVLERTVREQDTVARQGGDEFAVLAPETGPAAAGALMRRIEEALAGIDAAGIPISASVGWALCPDDATDPVALAESADARQRAVKRSRRASVGAARRRLSA